MTESLPQQPPEDLPDYGMTSDAGNARLAVALRAVAAAVSGGEVERREAVMALGDAVRDIGADHPEVTDITVRDAIVRELQPAFERAGWKVLEPYEF